MSSLDNFNLDDLDDEVREGEDNTGRVLRILRHHRRENMGQHTAILVEMRDGFKRINGDVETLQGQELTRQLDEREAVGLAKGRRGGLSWQALTAALAALAIGIGVVGYVLEVIAGKVG